MLQDVLFNVEPNITTITTTTKYKFISPFSQNLGNFKQNPWFALKADTLPRQFVHLVLGMLVSESLLLKFKINWKIFIYNKIWLIIFSEDELILMKHKMSLMPTLVFNHCQTFIKCECLILRFCVLSYFIFIRK